MKRVWLLQSRSVQQLCKPLMIQQPSKAASIQQACAGVAV
jgi:hypothetical protein